MPVTLAAADFVSVFADRSFSEHASAAVRFYGFEPEEAALTALKPIAGRLHECRGVWRIISTSDWVLGAVDDGHKINWIDRLSAVPHRSGDSPTTEEGKIILDKEVAAMIEKKAIKVVTSSKDEVISGFFARPKKTRGSSDLSCLSNTRNPS